MRATLKTLAEKTNLSITTISMILNGKSIRVSEKTRQNVLRLAKEHHYHPNSLARGLATKRTNIIGLILPDITNYFFAETAKFIENRLKEFGYGLILCNTSDQAEEEEKYIDLLLSHGVDALLICVSNESLFDKKRLERLQKLDIACVAIDRWSDAMPFPHVAIDNFKGAYLATKHLIDNGHRSIGCISGPNNVMSSQDRLSGYKKALIDNGISFDETKVTTGSYTFDSGYEAGLKLLKTASVSAVFVSNDMMAYGFYKACREMNKSIPDDISVVGFDDLIFSSTLDVPLTSLKQSTETLASKACEIILNNLRGIPDNNNYVLLPTLSERSSVLKK